jgi:hypothetical protein
LVSEKIGVVAGIVSAFKFALPKEEEDGEHRKERKEHGVDDVKNTAQFADGHASSFVSRWKDKHNGGLHLALRIELNGDQIHMNVLHVGLTPNSTVACSGDGWKPLILIQSLSKAYTHGLP